jgi:RND family efflux transporter MFP subunit
MRAITTGRRHEKGKKQLLRYFFLFFIPGLLLTGCGPKTEPPAAPVKRPIISGVAIATLAPTQVDEFYEAAGTIKAARTISVAGRMMGSVTSLLVKEGDVVANGQLLLTIDDRDVVQKVKAAEAAHREAIKALAAASQNSELSDITYRRYRKMYEEKAISRQEMDQFETGKKLAGLEYERVQEMVNRTAANLSEAKVYMGFTGICSPLNGLVVEKKIEVGAMAAPGMPLLTLESRDGFQAEVTVDEMLSGKLRIGMPVLISVDAINRNVPGKISEILPAVDPVSRSFVVRIPLSGNDGLRSGLYARMRIVRGKKDVILAPHSAIVEKGQLTGIYAVDNHGVVAYRLVKIGMQYGDNREILSGLKPNDRIVVEGVQKAEDGGIIENVKQQ